MDRPARPERLARVARVLRTEWVTPHLVRVVLGGEGLSGFPAGEYTDHYVKLLLPPPGAPYRAPFDVEDLRATLPADQWPVTRTYTVRDWDAGAGELTVDFVHHGDVGVAGPWAAAARPGDEVQLSGPGGAYAPSPDAAWHLLAGDESALPAIAAALGRIPAGAVGRVLVEVADAGERQHLEPPPGVELTWVLRGPAPVGQALVAAVVGADLPAGPPHAFVHGEAGFVRELRRFLRVDLAVPREQLSVSGYWRQGSTEEGWRAQKRDWNAAVEADERTAVAG